MEKKPRFKNSFNVQGTFGELMHFKEKVIAMGWEQYENQVNNFDVNLKAFQFKQHYSGNECNKNSFWNIVSLGNAESISLSTPDGWQRALSLAEEKEEEFDFICETSGEKFNKGESAFLVCRSDGEPNNRDFRITEYINCDSWDSCAYFHKQEDAKKYSEKIKSEIARQELLEEAKNRGFVQGVKFRSTWGNTRNLLNGVFYYDDNGEPALTDGSDEGGNFIFENGKWATIIPDEINELKPTSPTKEEIERVLNHLINELNKTEK